MELQTIFLLGTVAATAAGILGVFYVCAASVRDATAMHDITVEARMMRIEFDRRVSARNAGKHADEQATIDEEPIMEV